MDESLNRNDSATERPQAGTSATAAWAQFDGQLQRYLLRRLRNAANAQDLAQEVYLRLLRFEGAAQVRDFRAYVYKIAAHVMYEFRFRARERFVTFDSEAVREWEQDSAQAESNPLEERLHAERELQALLAQLHPTCRAVLLAHKRDGLSYSEVAQRLGLSEHTVKKYVFRAMATLRMARRGQTGRRE
jgi:RNA polymerase sigma-70 factor (ECF subfamily)